MRSNRRFPTGSKISSRVVSTKGLLASIAAKWCTCAGAVSTESAIETNDSGGAGEATSGGEGDGEMVDRAVVSRRKSVTPAASSKNGTMHNNEGAELITDVIGVVAATCDLRKKLAKRCLRKTQFALLTREDLEWKAIYETFGARRDSISRE